MAGSPILEIVSRPHRPRPRCCVRLEGGRAADGQRFWPMAGSQLLGILLLAMIAGVILFRLYTVLGRRTGNEREPQDRLRRIEAGGAQASPDKVLTIPDRTASAA